jgi:arylsulfatase A-like enzyme
MWQPDRAGELQASGWSRRSFLSGTAGQRRAVGTPWSSAVPAGRRPATAAAELSGDAEYQHHYMGRNTVNPATAVALEAALRSGRTDG